MINIIKPKLTFKEALIKRNKTELIVLHHADSSKASVYDIHNWHLKRGWAGIGYHFYVTKAGEIYQGRPIDVIGAHAEGHNSNSIGICAEGNYQVEKTMPEAQKKALIELIKYVLSLYPNCKIVRHKDLMATDCPGQYYPFIDIVNAVKQQSKPQQNIKQGIVTVKSSLNIREAPSISAKIVGQYKPNEKITILVEQNGWYKTEKGWVSAKYVKLI